MWESAAALQGPAVGTKEGVAEEARWIRHGSQHPGQVRSTT